MPQLLLPVSVCAIFPRGSRLLPVLFQKRASCGRGFRLHRYDGQLRPRQESWNASCELLRQLAEEAEQRHITLALESLRQDETDLAYDLPTTRQLIEQVGHPSLKVMADTIATGACGETLEDWFAAFGSDLVHMHFLDGDPFVHNIWGDGNYPLEQMLRCLQANAYTGYLVQEVADERYFADPVAADLQNYRVLSRFFSD